MGLAAFNRARRLRAEKESNTITHDVNDRMTVAQLTEYAEANNIDLGDATKKADILAVIQGGE